MIFMACMRYKHTAPDEPFVGSISADTHALHGALASPHTAYNLTVVLSHCLTSIGDSTPLPSINMSRSHASVELAPTHPRGQLRDEVLQQLHHPGFDSQQHKYHHAYASAGHDTSEHDLYASTAHCHGRASTSDIHLAAGDFNQLPRCNDYC